MKLKYPPISFDNDHSYPDSSVTQGIPVEGREIQDSVSQGVQGVNHKIRGIGQLRRAKMHISCLIDNLDNKNAITPALRELLEASFILQTTSTKILAPYLKRSPATIRTEFLRILSILGERGRHFNV